MKRKMILDEMQEQKRLKIESIGLWIAYFSLLAAILGQSAVLREFSLRNIVGELAVMLVVGVYLLISYWKHGLWSTTGKPSLMTNCFVSMSLGLGLALFSGILSYTVLGVIMDSVAIALSVFWISFALCLAVLTFFAALFKRRIKKLEDETEPVGDKL